MKFIPDNFTPPRQIEINNLGRLRPLQESDLELDYQTVMSSIDIIKIVRGGSWPQPSMTKDEDRKDLVWHEAEFALRASFAYIFLAPDGKESLGCLYIYPPTKPWLNPPPGADSVVNLWVTQKAYDRGIYPKFFSFVKTWLSAAWPFQNVFYSNIVIPNEATLA